MRYIYRTCPCGDIKGVGTDSYLLFKSIRYAHAERWEPPEETTGWIGTYDATVPTPYCCQHDAFIAEKTATGKFYCDEIVDKPAILYSEDCLRLNIWTPIGAENAPVLVYIHGGSYETGGSGYNGEVYCRQGILLVTIQYRLNAFSSAVGDGHTGNYGLQDQICALQWIKHNIAAFGGDPNRVTIMGESAGAMSVQCLILSPLAKGLFRGAIMLSGGGLLPKAFGMKDGSIAKELWRKIQDAFGAANLDELKTVPAKEIYLTWLRISSSDFRYVFPATPIIDGYTLPDEPRELVRTRRINAVPAIISILSEDMWPLDLYRSAVEWAFLMERAAYPAVYGLYFDRAIPGDHYGAFHGGDLRYAFHTFNTSWRPFDEIDERISENMVEYFVNFAKTGVPSGNGLATWEPIREENCGFMHFGDDPCKMCFVPEDRLLSVQKRGKPFPGM